MDFIDFYIIFGIISLMIYMIRDVSWIMDYSMWLFCEEPYAYYAYYNSIK